MLDLWKSGRGQSLKKKKNEMITHCFNTNKHSSNFWGTTCLFFRIGKFAQQNGEMNRRGGGNYNYISATKTSVKDYIIKTCYAGFPKIIQRHVSSHFLGIMIYLLIEIEIKRHYLLISQSLLQKTIIFIPFLLTYHI